MEKKEIPNAISQVIDEVNRISEVYKESELTPSKIIRKLQDKHGWSNKTLDQHQWIVEPLIKDVIKIINAKLIKK